MLSSSSASVIRLLARTPARTTLRTPVSRGLANLSVVRNTTRPKFGRTRRLVFGAVLLASFALATTRVHADAQAESSNVVSTYDTINAITFSNSAYAVVDPSTAITFPKTLHIPSRVPIPDLSLIGVGVRTVSFLGFKVYSVAFYADLRNPALQVRTRFRYHLAPSSCVERYLGQLLQKKRLIASSKTRPALLGSSPRGLHRIVTFVMVS